MYGTKIRTIRMMRGYSQDYMAKALNIRQNLYSQIENNQKKPDDATIQLIAKTLGVSTDDIKSSMPIIINFGHHQHNGEDGLQQTALQEKLIEELTRQLQVKDTQLMGKDEQINHLLKMLNEAGKQLS